jgi:hypothetical protein
LDLYKEKNIEGMFFKTLKDLQCWQNKDDEFWIMKRVFLLNVWTICLDAIIFKLKLVSNKVIHGEVYFKQDSRVDNGKKMWGFWKTIVATCPQSLVYETFNN